MTTESIPVSLSISEETGEPVEGELVRLLKDGSARALGLVYDRHNGVVRGFARRLVGDHAAAEDLVHEVFVTLPGAIARFEGHSSIRSFLLAIAVNHARHHLRAAARRRKAMEKLSLEQPTVSDANPERSVSAASLARALCRALDTLPLDQRVAFVLCEVEERTSREASEIVGAPEGTIRTRLHHAKLKLRKELEREGIR
jgi:RNA polymerase sigma-70 factor, ECF subfamily